MRLYAEHVVGAETAGPGWVEVTDGRISDSGNGAAGPGDEHVGAWLYPGFVDIHCHGGGGASFDGTPGDAAAAATFHLASGTTTMLASLVSAPIDRLAEQIARLSDGIESGALGPVRGIHLEGPFLSADHRGAHDPTALRDPTPETIDLLLAAGRGRVRMVTIAPELPGGEAAIQRLAAAGVVVAIGHTACDYDQAVAAFAGGATVLTHAGNAMSPIHHRAPGPVVAALEVGAYVELVVDGVHLHDAWARRIARDAGARAVLVTDAMAAAGRPDGEYVLGPLRVRMSDGVVRLIDGGSIAGSTLRMAGAVARAQLDLRLPPAAVAHAAATAPSTALGWSGELGRVAVGQRADLVALDDRLGVRRVMRGGEWQAG